jgi:hypothetical protein
MYHFCKLATDNVTDPQKYDEGCQFIRCRKSDFRATYSAPKATALQITGVAVLSGFKTMDIPLFNEVSIPTNTNWNTNWTFENYTV